MKMKKEKKNINGCKIKCILILFMLCKLLICVIFFSIFFFFDKKWWMNTCSTFTIKFTFINLNGKCICINAVTKTLLSLSFIQIIGYLHSFNNYIPKSKWIEIKTNEILISSFLKYKLILCESLFICVINFKIA